MAISITRRWLCALLIGTWLSLSGAAGMAATGLLVINVDATGVDAKGVRRDSYEPLGRFTLIEVNTKKGVSFLQPRGVQIEELEEGLYCLATIQWGLNVTFDFCERPYIQVTAGKTVNAGHWEYGVAPDHRSGQRLLVFAHTKRTLAAAQAREPEKLARYPEVETPSAGRLVLAPEVDFAIKPLAALNEGDEARLRAFYDGLPSTDKPPFPMNGLAGALDRASTRLAERLYEDRLPHAKVLVTVNSDGKVVKSEVLSSSSRAAAQAVIDAASGLAFKPPVCAAGPCTMEFPIYVRWQYQL